MERLEKYIISRSKLLLLAILYVGLFDFFYIFWLSETFDYLGFEYHSLETEYWVYIHFLALLPVLWIKDDLKRPSLLMYWLLYILTYIPAVILPFFIQLNQPNDLIYLPLTLAIGMFIIGLSYIVPIIRIESFIVRSSEVNSVLLIMSLVFLAYTTFVFKDNLRLVGLNEIYDLREESDEVTKGNGLIGYVTMILSYCLLPILMIRGLIDSKPLYFLFGIGGQLILFMTAGSKVNLFSALIVIGIYYLLRKHTAHIGQRLLLALSSTLGVLVLVSEFASERIQDFVSIVSSVLFMRTMSMGGMLMSQYYYFFQSHPTTNYSHVNIVNRFVEYPYGDVPIGRVIGHYYSGNELLNANANMWVTDGVGAMGLKGILLISLFCALVFWVFDALAAKHSPLFSALCVVIITLAFLNTSIFTTLLSGGLIVMMVILNIYPPVNLNLKKA